MSELVAANDMPRRGATRASKIELESWVRLAREPESPLLDQPAPGVALAVSKAELVDARLHLRLHVTVKLPGPVAFGHHQLGQAVIITVSDTHGEWVGSCSLLDPNKTFPRYQGNNYTGPAELTAGGMMVTSYFGVDISVPVVVPAEPEPSVFVTAMCNRLSARVVEISLAGAEPIIEPKPVRSEVPGADEVEGEP